ncbi:phosphatidylglycerophosphatase A family protein [Acinetobacter rathckeae]|uniref:phosphatidylglycerophosphatase A family protein n=1 Tax=Acinetobacter rathckeae TaxID=2605272 RepID=UPI0018A2AAC5|nr:phosphatidylglycerophosphatase A [Acinetobacter rathckeae]MBF7695295.1 phosphatidylglycerophosphatase A [Acinetobacter rathckeae]
MDTNTLHKPELRFSRLSWPQRLVVFLGVGLGSGLAPKAPGTFGSAFALLFIPIWYSIGFNLSLLAIIIMSVLGIAICGQTAKIMQVHDDGRIVWDEFAGQSTTFLPLIYFNIMSVQWLVVGFALFRLFDIWKPWPICVADKKLSGGFGIMFDDLLAGIWAALCIVLYLSI